MSEMNTKEKLEFIDKALEDAIETIKRLDKENKKYKEKFEGHLNCPRCGGEIWGPDLIAFNKE